MDCAPGSADAPGSRAGRHAPAREAGSGSRGPLRRAATEGSAQAPISLEKPVGDEHGSEFGQFIADEQSQSPYERAATVLRQQAVRAALEDLSPRERRVLVMRYGLDGLPPRTLDQVGRALTVTRERIRQIESGCLLKLRNLDQTQQLREDAP